MTQRRLILTAPLLLFCIFMAVSSIKVKAQTDIKKSEKTEIINGKKFILHAVIKGQTLYSISKLYNVAVNYILAHNPDAIDGLRTGQVLKIPASDNQTPVKTTSTTTGDGHTRTHTVEPGQTLFSISKKYNVSEAEILDLNPEAKKNGLKAGEVIKIPASKETTVTKTDTAATQKKNWQKKFIEKKQPATPAIQETPAIAPPIVVEIPSTAKSSYNIALFLPFNAEQVNSLDLAKVIAGEEIFPAKSEIAIEFYQGALLAVDSLKKAGLACHVFVYDLDDKDSLLLPQVLSRPELKTMDLIIGPLSANSFMKVASFAKKNKIFICSPFTQVNKILLSNPFVSKATPSTSSQLEEVAHFISEKYPKENIVLGNFTPKESTVAHGFKTSMNKLLAKKGSSADTVREAKNFAALKSSLSASKTNIVVFPSTDQSKVTDFLNNLNMVKGHKIILFGLQNWVNFDNLDLDYLNHLQFHYASSTYVDHTLEPTTRFTKQYKELYKAEASSYAYQGFDVTFYYLQALKQFGLSFQQKLPQNNWQGLQSSFRFVQTSVESGYENKASYILRYDNYSVLKAD